MLESSSLRMNQHGSCDVFLFNDPAAAEIYTLSLHDALPIYHAAAARRQGAVRRPAVRRDGGLGEPLADRKSTRLNSSHVSISYAVFCLKKKTGIKHAFFYCGSRRAIAATGCALASSRATIAP